MKKQGSGGIGSSLSLSVLLHVLLAAAIFGFWWWNRTPEPAGERLALTATIVESAPVTTEPPPPPVVEPPTPEPAPIAEPELPPPDEAAEKEREAAVAEERRLAAEREATEREAREKAQRDKLEREKLERERIEREKQERERKAKAEAEKARVRREAELNAQLAAEERLAAVRASGQMAQYISQITARIERAWIRPASATAGLQCEVRVTQVPGGVVTGVQVGRCNGDETVRQSIEAAVYRASPLPQPTDAVLFERNLVVTFRPEQ